MGLCVSAGGPFRSGVRAFGAMAAAYREYLATERGYEDAKRHLDAWSAHVRHAVWLPSGRTFDVSTLMWHSTILGSCETPWMARTCSRSTAR